MRAVDKRLGKFTTKSQGGVLGFFIVGSGYHFSDRIVFVHGVCFASFTTQYKVSCNWRVKAIIDSQQLVLTSKYPDFRGAMHFSIIGYAKLSVYHAESFLLYS